MELDFCSCMKCQIVGAYLLAAKEVDFCTCRKCQVVGASLLEAKELDFCTCRKCQIVYSFGYLEGYTSAPATRKCQGVGFTATWPGSYTSIPAGSAG
jgi:hypothetical protein